MTTFYWSLPYGGRACKYVTLGGRTHPVFTSCRAWLRQAWVLYKTGQSDEDSDGEAVSPSIHQKSLETHRDHEGIFYGSVEYVVTRQAHNLKQRMLNAVTAPIFIRP